MTEPTNPQPADESFPAEKPLPLTTERAEQSEGAAPTERAQPAESTEPLAEGQPKVKIQVGRPGPISSESRNQQTGFSGGGQQRGPGHPSGDRKGRERRDRKPQEREGRPQLEPLQVHAVVPAPSRRDQVSADLEAEINDALGGMSLEEIVSGSSASAIGLPLEPDSRVRASVVRVHGDNVFFALTGRNEGVISVRQFATPPEAGAILDVIVRGFNAEDGLYEITVPGASISVSDWSDISEGSVVDARVTGSNAGGLECMVNNIRGFIPASQISLYRVENLSDFENQKLLCVVTEANPNRRNLVLSHRAVLEREKEESREQLMKELDVGQKREGIVRSLRDFGAFVDLGGVDGLIHISQLSWDRVKHPSEILQEGQKVLVKVEKIDRDTGKIGLSYRDLLDHPWHNIEERLTAGAVVKGTVTRLAKFGAFVKIAPGIEGLIHISEISHQHVRNLATMLQEGQEVEVKVLAVDPENQRIGLSLKATMPAPEQKVTAEQPDEPARKPTFSRGSEPLKGGMDKPSGGDKFGLQW